MNKNWPNDFRINCKSPFNLVELIEKDFNFEIVEEFEDSFEWNELSNILKCSQNLFDFPFLKVL